MSAYKSNNMIAIHNKTNEMLKEMPEFFKVYVNARSKRLAPSTLLSYTYKFKIFLQYLHDDNSYFGLKKIKDVTLEDIALLQHEDILDFVSWLKNHIIQYKEQKRGTYDVEQANITIDSYLACLSSVWNYYKRLNKDIHFNPVESIERSKIKEKPIIYLTENEKRDLLQGINNGMGLRGLELVYHDKNKLRDETICRLLLNTGIRVSELVGLDMEHINFDNHYITVTRKGGNIDNVYFSDTVENYLKQYIEVRKEYKPKDDENAVFLNRFGERMGVRGIEKLIKKYTTAILPNKLEKITPHKLRSTYATEMYEKTRDIELVRSQLGQNSLGVVLKYTRAKQRDMEKNRNIL